VLKNPFEIGNVVRFAPSEGTRSLYQNIERFGVAIGEEAEVKSIRDNVYAWSAPATPPLR
jgi:hypothetical protein